jgi:uncharacterized protein (DUF4415 family)
MTVSNANMESTWIDPDDAPELTDEWFEKATFRIGNQVIRRGRPAGETKTQVSLRIDNDVLAAFRADGPGWQSRMNAVLKKAAGV